MVLNALLRYCRVSEERTTYELRDRDPFRSHPEDSAVSICVGRSITRGSRYLDAVRLSIFLSVAILSAPANAQVVVRPSCISPILCTGLVPEALSIYATMPDTNGLQQVTTSFRVVNHGPGAARPSSTLVKSVGALTYLPTPSLAAGATAFFSTTIATTATDFTINVTTANNNASTFHFVSNAPALGRWRPLGPSMIVGGRSQTPEGVGVITAIAVDPSST